MREFENALKKSRREIGTRLIRKHPKYRYWLPMMRFAGVFIGRTKGQMLEADYLWMRDVDDRADGDVPVDESYNSVAHYVEEKLSFLDSPGSPRDDTDMLILLCERLSEETGIKLHEERELILRSMLFDAQRYGKRQIFPESELQEHFYRCDIEGTGRGTLKLFGEDPEKWQYVEPLGIASRIYDNLHDYEEDITAGYINIPVEDVERFGIVPEDFGNIHSPHIQEWFQSEAKRGIELLNLDNELFPQGSFRPIGRAFVHLYHRLPTRNFLMRTLHEE